VLTARERLDLLDPLQPPRPYLAMPRTPSPERPPPKKQRVIFSGASMDTDDAQWYQDVFPIASNTGGEAEDRLVSHASSSAAGMIVDIETSIADSVVPLRSTLLNHTTNVQDYSPGIIPRKL
jgi:hypothetical protein